MPIINIEGEIGWSVDLHDVREQLKKANGKDVVVHIASPGGLVSEGLKIRNELKNYKGNVDTHLTGMVASMGTYISLIGKKRTAEQNAIFMIHNPSMGAWGDHRVMSKANKILSSMTGMIAKEYVAKSNLTDIKAKNAMNDETYYFGDEILDAGFIHEIIGEEDAEDRAEAIAVAQILFQDCQAKVNEPESAKKDIAALLTMKLDEPIKPVKPDSRKPDNIKSEVKKMDLAELKEKHPELYAQVMALGKAEGETVGIDQERTRVKGLTEMRAKFKKPHSQNVIDQAISEGHDMAQVSVNLMAADQTAQELEDSEEDNADGTQNGEGDAPEMKDGQMTHIDHLDARAKELAGMPGIM